MSHPGFEFLKWGVSLSLLAGVITYAVYDQFFSSSSSQSPTSTSTPTASPTSLKWYNRPIFVISMVILMWLLCFGVAMSRYLNAIQDQQGAERAAYADVYDYEQKEFKTTFYKLMYYWGIFSYVIGVIVVLVIMASSRRVF